MDDSVSKFRQMWLKRLEKRTGLERVPLARSTRLAILYSAAFCLLSSTVLSLSHPPHAGKIAGTIALSLLCIGCFWEALLCLQPVHGRRNTHLCTLYTLVLMALILGELCCQGACLAMETSQEGISKFLFLSQPILQPHFLAPAVLTLLLGPIYGVVAALGLTVLFTLQLGLNVPVSGNFSAANVLPFVVASLVTGLLSSALVPRLVLEGKIRRSFHLIRVALLAAIAPVAGLLVGGLCVWIVHPDTLVDYYSSNSSWAFAAIGLVFVAIASNLLQGAIAAAVLPAIEHVFALTSSITLQNLTDLASPLMDRLAQEAPGTLNHSMAVSTIAAMAADSIGANSLLARVGAYYHDIGKLSKPAMFTENQSGMANPHNQLAPLTSATWIRSHVKNGLALAAQYRLPRPIRQIIAEHHGTTVLAYFYYKAVENAKASGAEADSVSDLQFRYEGPKPSTKESGIILLADSAEAAINSLPHHTAHAIETKVDEIFFQKLQDGQFDECHLTMGELATIRDSIKSSLITKYHSRIAYPKDEEAETASENHEEADKA